jgi:hypothetical protein
VWKRVPQVWLFHQVKNCTINVFIAILAARMALPAYGVRWLQWQGFYRQPFPALPELPQS